MFGHYDSDTQSNKCEQSLDINYVVMSTLTTADFLMQFRSPHFLVTANDQQMAEFQISIAARMIGSNKDKKKGARVSISLYIECRALFNRYHT